MEVSTEMSKIMTNNTSNISADISMNGQKLEDVTSFKYVGANLCKAAPAKQKSALGWPQQTKQDLAVQHHQLCKQFQGLQVSRHLYTPLLL